MNSDTLFRTGGCLLVAVALAACGGGNSDPEKNPPTISVQPQNQSALTDATATFTVSASGTGLGYQWQKNGTAIAGATASSYTTPAASYLDSGAKYRVVVTNVDGSVTSAEAQLTLALSADQQAFESLYVAAGAGSYAVHWNLNSSGPQTSGTHFAYTDLATPVPSPLTSGPQVRIQEAPQNIASTLPLPAFAPERVLKDGAILVMPTQLSSVRFSYVGSEVQVDTLAADGTTIAYSEMRSGFSVVPLTGTLGATPAEFAHWFDAFFSNAAVLNPAATYAAGASYLKFGRVNKGDRYTAFDCIPASNDANVIPCATGTTIEALLSAGYNSNSDGRTYHLGDGAVSTVGGVPVWVAWTPRPRSASWNGTVQYRTYFQLNGNVYTGMLIKDGAALGGSYWVSNPGGATVEDRTTPLSYHIRLNKAARDSLAAASAI